MESIGGPFIHDGVLISGVRVGLGQSVEVGEAGGD